MNAAPPSVEAYLASLPAASRAALEKLRRTIEKAVPDAVELIAYGMPSFKYQGRPLIYYGAAKKHCAIYGMPAQIEAFQAELAAFSTSKGTIRFAPDQPPSESLVRALLSKRIEEIEAARGSRRRRK
jgi:uncharacterized protein YdhG (YjbR/CyaY superfamily)